MKSKIEKINYPILKEEIYQVKLTNGLQVVFIPKHDYEEVIGLVTVKFGALDTSFVPKNRKRLKKFPSGIAHFIEHRLFEMPDGQDVSQLFSQIGAEVNAFTSYHQTSYYFSTVSEISEALKLLQSFTGYAKFNEASIAREKLIINQEINMYQDDPDYQLYMSILDQLYPHTALAEDIAGQIDTVADIEVSDLKSNFDMFYQPSNMLLLLAGRIDIDECLETIEIEQAQRRLKKVHPIVRGQLELSPIKASASIEMEVNSPKLAVGIRSQLVFTDMSILHYKVALKLLFSLILGWTSKSYQDFYEKGKIDDSFFMEIEITDAYQFVILTLDTSEPLAMSKRLRQLIQGFEKLEDLNEEHLMLVKNEMYGDFLKSMNNLEFIATQYVNGWISSVDYFKLPEILDQLNLELIVNIGRTFVEKAEMTDFVIFPK